MLLTNQRSQPRYRLLYLLKNLTQIVAVEHEDTPWLLDDILMIAVELSKLFSLELQILYINLVRLIYFLWGCFIIIVYNLLPDCQVEVIDLLYLVEFSVVNISERVRLAEEGAVDVVEEVQACEPVVVDGMVADGFIWWCIVCFWRVW